MLFPTLVARMKQVRDLAGLRIYAREIGPLVQIAVNSGEGQVLQAIRSPVDFWHNVLDMQGGQGRIVLMQLAILAPVAGPFPHPRSGLQIHDFKLPGGSRPGPDA